MGWFLQSEYEIRFEWGLEGAKRLSSEVDLAVVVDVLSFSTCVEVGVTAGAQIFPFYFKDDRATEYARSINAVCASATRLKNEICLSPATLATLKSGDRVVLPSPNGSTICFSLETPIILCGCLRNAAVTAQAANRLGKRILVIAAGEQWEGSSLRPAIEDMIGAGAILSKLKGNLSPEAIAAVQVFEHFKNDLLSTLNSSSSGKELIERGFPEDNEIASELDVSTTVPILQDKGFSRLKQ